MRKMLLQRLLRSNNCRMSDNELNKIAELTEGYSGSDLTNLAKDAALGPIRGEKTTTYYMKYFRVLYKILRVFLT